MSFVNTLPVQRVRPVLALPLWLGTLRDASGYGNHATNTGCRWGGCTRDGVSTYVATDYLTVAASPELHSTRGTIFAAGCYNDTTLANQAVVDKRAAGQTGFMFRLQAAAMLLDAVSGVSFLPVSSWLGSSLAVTFEDGAKPEFYVAGAHAGQGNVALTIAAAPVAMTIGNSYTAPSNLHNRNQLDALLYYTDVLTAAEVAATHDYLDARITPRKQWPAQGLDYTTPSGRPTYVDNIQTARVSLADETGGRLSNIGLSVLSGAWRVVEGAGGRWISCVADGTLRRRLPGADTYTIARFAETGGVVLTTSASAIELAATAGDTISALVLTAP